MEMMNEIEENMPDKSLFTVGEVYEIYNNHDYLSLIYRWCENNNYEVDYVDFNTKSKLVGYGHTEEEKIYFDGISVSVKEKQKQKVL